MRYRCASITACSPLTVRVSYVLCIFFWSLFSKISARVLQAFSCIAGCGCLALFGTMFLIGVIRVLLGGEISLSQHVPLALFLLVVPAVNAFEGLYSGVPPALPEEMRLLGISTSIAYFSIAIFLFLGRGDLPSRTVYVWSWFLSLGTVPLVRCALRSRFSREAWWRVPTVVFGAGELVPRVTEYLNKHTEAGLLLKAHFVSQKCTEAEKEQKNTPQDTL